MAATGKWFGLGLSDVANAAIDWDTDTIKASLHTVTYVPNQDTNHFFSPDATNELSAAGYTSGGIALTSTTRTYDTSTNEVRLDAADLLWTGLSGTFQIIVFRKDTGTSTTSPMIGWIDLGAATSPGGGNFAVQFDATGVFKITAA